MSESESTEDLPSTPVGIVEQNNTELVMFLFAIIALLLSIVFLIIEIIVFFYPTLVTSNHICGPVVSSNTTTTTNTNTNTSNTTNTTNTRPSKQPAFETYGAWLARIRTTTPPKPRPTVTTI
jgi:hypothetical protein